MGNIENLLKHGKTEIMSFKGLKELLSEFVSASSEESFDLEKFDPTNDVETKPFGRAVDSAFYEYRKRQYLTSYVLESYRYYRKHFSKMIVDKGLDEVISNLPDGFKGATSEDISDLFKVDEREISDYIKGRADLPKYAKKIVDALKTLDKPMLGYDLMPYGKGRNDEDKYVIYINTPRSKELFSFGHLFMLYCLSEEIRPKVTLDTGKAKARTAIYVTKEDLEKTLTSLEHFSDVFKYTVDRMGTPIATGLSSNIYAVTEMKNGYEYPEIFKSISLKAISLYIASLILYDKEFFETLSIEEKSDILILARLENYNFNYDKVKPDFIKINPVILKYIHLRRVDLKDEARLSILEDALEKMFSLYNFKDTAHSLYPISVSNDIYEGLDVSFATDYESDILTNYKYYIERELQKLSSFDEIPAEAAEIACQNIHRILTTYQHVATSIEAYWDSINYHMFEDYVSTIPYYSPFNENQDTENIEGQKKVYYRYVADKYNLYLIQNGYKEENPNVGRH